MNAAGTASIEMPRYQSHKTVWALKIATVVSCGTDTTTDENPIVELHFEDQNYAPRRMNLRGKPTPEAGWYYVKYRDGYESFSPAKEFEDGNTPIATQAVSGSLPHQQREITEKAELDEKLLKLAAFIQDNPLFQKLPEAEQERMSRQLQHMSGYSYALQERIEAFTVPAADTTV